MNAVERSYLAGRQLVDDQTAHIGVVVHDRCRVTEEDLLVDEPFVGQVVVKAVELPHTVVLDHYHRRTVLDGKR